MPVRVESNDRMRFHAADVNLDSENRAHRRTIHEKMAVELTDTNFADLALASEKPVLVDFWAEWCGPCRMVGPVVEEIALEYGDKAVIGKVNVDHNSGTSAQFGIRNIPTILFIKNGQVVDKVVGAVPKQVLVEKLDALM
jgi:thioredoxin 1